MILSSSISAKPEEKSKKSENEEGRVPGGEGEVLTAFLALEVFSLSTSFKYEYYRMYSISLRCKIHALNMYTARGRGNKLRTQKPK